MLEYLKEQLFRCSPGQIILIEASRGLESGSVLSNAHQVHYQLLLSLNSFILIEIYRLDSPFVHVFFGRSRLFGIKGCIHHLYAIYKIQVCILFLFFLFRNMTETSAARKGSIVVQIVILNIQVFWRAGYRWLNPFFVGSPLAT